MTYQLAPRVTYCITGDRVVFHDLRADAYLSLQQVESDIFRAFATTGTIMSDLIADLESVGLLSATPLEFRPISEVNWVAPDESALDSPVRKVAIGQIA